jgi:hypothetical protein
MRLAFFQKMRGANFLSVMVGPLDIMLPMRWLEGPARTQHPKAFTDDSQPAVGAAGQEGGAA